MIRGSFDWTRKANVGRRHPREALMRAIGRISRPFHVTCAGRCTATSRVASRRRRTASLPPNLGRAEVRPLAMMLAAVAQYSANRGLGHTPDHTPDPSTRNARFGANPTRLVRVLDAPSSEVTPSTKGGETTVTTTALTT